MKSIILTVNNSNLTVDVDKKSFTDCTNEEGAKFFKGYYRNREEFFEKYINRIRAIEQFDVVDFSAELVELYDKAEPFTYKEAFELTNDSFRAMVFGTINVTEMVNNLGATRIKTDGTTSKQKLFDKDGTFKGETEITNVYEVYEMSGEKLGVEEKLYALKCWCTSTATEHWLWIEEQYKDNPLEAVASTFRVHSDLIDKIKEIKRQGDILLVEIKEEHKDYVPSGEIVPLTAKQYFGLLTTQA